MSNDAFDCASCFRIDITEDSDTEPTEQFNISFTVISVQPEGVSINTFSEAIIYIQDGDGKNHYWATLQIIERQHEQYSWHGLLMLIETIGNTRYMIYTTCIPRPLTYQSFLLPLPTLHNLLH